MPWKLSTSQTPVSQTKLKPPMIPGGGFGPVSEDGYGVSYIFTGEDMLFFHVSSNRNCPKTVFLMFDTHFKLSRLLLVKISLNLFKIL